MTYSEKKLRLHKLIVNRSANKDNSNDEEIKRLEKEINYFEWGIR